MLAGDTAGFPNGRRPGDDVVDIELRVAMGILLTDAEAPSRNLPYTDQVGVKATDFAQYVPVPQHAAPGCAGLIDETHALRQCIAGVACGQELHESIEHPARSRAQSGRLAAYASRPGCSS